MADYVLLPATTYRAPSPQGRKKARHLNTIVEEDFVEVKPSRHAAVRGRAQTSSQDKIEQWLSPMSDHFPTPRGFHFLAAPILPSSPSAVSMDESASPHSSSASSGPTDPWRRTSCMTEATEFDDLDIYDVSEDEDARKTTTITRQSSVRKSSIRSSVSSAKALPRLSIPREQQAPTAPASAHAEFKKFSSPVGPTPTSAVPMSPTMMNYIQAQQSIEVPTISAPPSLDGSLSSDQLAQMSAPPTPIMGGQDEDDQGWSGVHLQPGALATLDALSGSTAGSDVDYAEHQEQVLEVTIPVEPEQPAQEMSEMRQAGPLRLFTQLSQPQRNNSSVLLSPAQQRSLAGLTRLDIPSPGGFFSGLSPRSRSTWQSMTPAEEAPPTSTTAEQFYNIPWKTQAAPIMPALPPPPPRPLHMTSGDFSSLPVEQFIETETKVLAGDCPTAYRVEPTPVTARIVPVVQPSVSSVTLEEPAASTPVEEVVADEIVTDYDPNYVRQQQEANSSQVGRTEMWLMAQFAYVRNTNVMSETETEDEDEEQQEAKTAEPEQPKLEIAPSVPPKDTNITALTRRKTVRFTEDVKSPRTKLPRCLPSKLIHLESAYYRAFTDLLVRTSPGDAFTNRLPRFEALQAQRVSLRTSHRNQLLGKYQLSVVPQSAKRRMSANVVRGDADLTDDPTKLRADKEADARAQMSMPAWQVAAHKILNGGRLIAAAPVHKRLARLSRMVPTNGVARDRARILDLGGQGTCDWAWHAAIAYPNTKIYTVTTKTVRQLSNAHIRGPPNHRQVAVERLTRLPFADNQFDLVRASELHSLLKLVGENGQDEWEACLGECMRVLKPGGYLEFQVMDSDMVNAGPLGNAKSVEFGFALKTLGYDPSPSKMFAGRLARAGFDNIRRAWVCLPCGPKPTAADAAAAPVDPKTGLPVETVAMEAMVSGSADAMAAVTGLVGGWSWERWLLRCEVERVAGELRLSDIATSGSRAVSEAGKSIEGVHAVVEEGRACGAGWRMLRGFARKPTPRVETIDIVLDL